MFLVSLTSRMSSREEMTKTTKVHKDTDQCLVELSHIGRMSTQEMEASAKSYLWVHVIFDSGGLMFYVHTPNRRGNGHSEVLVLFHLKSYSSI